MAPARKSLEEYLARAYPFRVIDSEYGGYVILFPDLPGCMTEVDSLDEVGPMAEEIRNLWLESAYERGLPIPEPSVQDDDQMGDGGSPENSV